MLHRIPAIEKVEQAIGWKPTVSLERILADVIGYCRAVPPTVQPEELSAAR